jgi:hypothetical protein
MQLGIPKASLFPANALETNHPRTEIIDFAGKPYTAERLADWLSIPKDRVRRGGEADEAIRTTHGDIVVILGQDAKIESAVAAPAR